MIRSDAVTLKRLRAFGAVIEFGTITAAAEALNLTPPAVHTQLKALEENLGAKLIRRSSDAAWTATASGHEVLRALEGIEAALGTCLRKVEAIEKGLTGVVSLRVISTGKYFAPGLVAGIQAAYPEIEVELRIGNRTETISALETKSADLVIMGRPPRRPEVDADPLGVHPHVIIAPPEHRLAGMPDVAPEELLSETFLTREDGSGTRILASRYLDRIGDGLPYKSVEMGTNETIKQAVMAGLGVALISQQTVTAELLSGRLVALRAAGLPIERQWYLVKRRDAVLSAAAANLRQFILQQNGSFLPMLDNAVAMRSGVQGAA